MYIRKYPQLGSTVTSFRVERVPLLRRFLVLARTIARQPAEICAMAPVAIQLACATPSDDIRYVGMFLSLGVFFAGISVGASTFGDEKGGNFSH